eukprot:SAG11_NODE_22269_length_409_cov_0.667742_1_plen_38_part_10
MKQFYDEATWSLRVDPEVDPRTIPQAFVNDKFQGKPYC